MEKTPTRMRRNGDTPDTDQLQRNQTTATVQRASAVVTAVEEETALDTVQRAKKRIQEAAAGARSRADALPALQDAFVDERNDVLAVINELEDQIDRDQEVREGLERELASKAEQLQGATARTQELEWQVVTLQTRVEALEQVRQQAAQFEEALSDANARAHRIKEQLASAEKERAQLRSEMKSTTKQLDELWSVRKERDTLQTDYKTLSLKVEELERSQREMFEERSQTQAEMQRIQGAFDETSNERNQLQMSLRAMEERVREFGQVQDSLVEKIDALRAEKKNLQVQIAHLERENSRLIEQRQFYECEVTSLRNQSRTAEAALTSVKKAFAEVRIALTDTKARTRRRSLDNWPRIGSTLRVPADGSETGSDAPGADAPSSISPSAGLADAMSEPTDATGSMTPGENS